MTLTHITHHQIYCQVVSEVSHAHYSVQNNTLREPFDHWSSYHVIVGLTNRLNTLLVTQWVFSAACYIVLLHKKENNHTHFVAHSVYKPHLKNCKLICCSNWRWPTFHKIQWSWKVIQKCSDHCVIQDTGGVLTRTLMHYIKDVMEWKPIPCSDDHH